MYLTPPLRPRRRLMAAPPSSSKETDLDPHSGKAIRPGCLLSPGGDFRFECSVGMPRQGSAKPTTLPQYEVNRTCLPCCRGAKVWCCVLMVSHMRVEGLLGRFNVREVVNWPLACANVSVVRTSRGGSASLISQASFALDYPHMLSPHCHPRRSS